jgi:hypothetical protein
MVGTTVGKKQGKASFISHPQPAGAGGVFLGGLIATVQDDDQR